MACTVSTYEKKARVLQYNIIYYIHINTHKKTWFITDLTQQVISVVRYNEAAIVQLHLPVLQQVIEHWQHISLCLLNPVQHQYPALQSRLHRTLTGDRIGRETTDSRHTVLHHHTKHNCTVNLEKNCG